MDNLMKQFIAFSLVVLCGSLSLAADVGSPVPQPTKNKRCECKDCKCGPNCNCPLYCDGGCECKTDKPEYEQICDGVTCRWVLKKKVNNSGVVTEQPKLYYYYWQYPDGRLVYLGSGTSPTYNGSVENVIPTMPVYPSGLSFPSGTQKGPIPTIPYQSTPAPCTNGRCTPIK
jgi:hypothetical protein